MSGSSTQWRAAPGIDPPVELFPAIERAAALGAAGFEHFHSEPQRQAWWGRLQLEGDSWFVKARQTRSRRERLASLVVARGLNREWRNTLWLRGTGLPSAEPVGFGEQRRRGMLRESYLVSRWVEGSLSLADYVEQQRNASNFDRLKVIRAAGWLFGQFFARDAIHKQFHPWNVLAVGDGAQGLELVPVDLQHLWAQRMLTEDDYLWALDQVSFWLHEPVIDWAVLDQACVFYDSVLESAGPGFTQNNRIRLSIERMLTAGRSTRKLHRKDWRSAGERT